MKKLLFLSMLTISTQSIFSCEFLTVKNNENYKIQNRDENIKCYTIKVKQKYHFFLDSNPSTGYSWKIIKKPLVNANIELSSKVVYDENKEVLCGQSGTQKVEIGFIEDGIYEIHFEYSKKSITDDEFKVVKKIIFNVVNR